MPHAEIKHSSDLKIDVPAILQNIETIINEHDSGAGACKGRAYPCADFHHTHFLVNISLLPKSHRDQAFMEKLSDDLETAIKAQISQACYFTMELNFSGKYYRTNQHDGA